MRYWTIIFTILLCSLTLTQAQDNTTSDDPYQIALQRITEAEASGATLLNLSGLNLSEIPPEIGNLTNLLALVVHSNQLGSVPSEIEDLISLQALDLSNNKLGDFPVEISNLTSLRTLRLDINQLIELPSEIGNLTNLQILSLYGNQLSNLPMEIGNLTNLHQLNLSSNGLSELPAEIGNLTNLQRLFISNNLLSELPAEIGELTNLCRLNISVNNFMSIPLELRSLKRLATQEDCTSWAWGLLLDDELLNTLPDEVANGGTSAILDYLENRALWHVRRMMISVASGIGAMVLVILGLRWHYRGRRKPKQKRELL